MIAKNKLQSHFLFKCDILMNYNTLSDFLYSIFFKIRFDNVRENINFLEQPSGNSYENSTYPSLVQCTTEVSESPKFFQTDPFLRVTYKDNNLIENNHSSMQNRPQISIKSIIINPDKGTVIDVTEDKKRKREEINNQEYPSKNKKQESAVNVPCSYTSINKLMHENIPSNSSMGNKKKQLVAREKKTERPLIQWVPFNPESLRAPQVKRPIGRPRKEPGYTYYESLQADKVQIDEFMEIARGNRTNIKP